MVLVLAVFPLPFGYYTFARIITCLACLESGMLFR
jgi:hypothetical protein